MVRGGLCPLVVEVRFLMAEDRRTSHLDSNDASSRQLDEKLQYRFHCT